jgi:hypothetical protein
VISIKASIMHRLEDKKEVVDMTNDEVKEQFMFYTKVAHIQLAPTTSTNISGIFADSTRLSMLPSTLQLGIYLKLGSETTMLSW